MPANAPEERLVEHHRYRCDVPPDKLLEQLREVAHPTAEFQLVSKLSGAGIVVRVLQSPDTPLPFHGQVEQASFALTLATRGQQMTPFQPIVHGRVHAASQGSELTLDLRLPKGVATLEWAGKLFAALLILAAAPGLATGTYAAALLLPFAALSWVFPGLRARYSFAHDCRRTLDTFEQAVPGLHRENIS